MQGLSCRLPIFQIPTSSKLTLVKTFQYKFANVGIVYIYDIEMEKWLISSNSKQKKYRMEVKRI